MPPFHLYLYLKRVDKMALINNLYVFVETEKVTRGVEVSSHPVEKGLNITDNIRSQAISISIDGMITGKDAKSIFQKLEMYHKQGKYVKYVGRTTLSNAIIESFDTDYDNTAWGAYKFSMEIKEIRIASAGIVKKSTKSTKSGTKQVTKSNQTKRYYTIKRGDTLWGIAKNYYGSGIQYKKIYNANKKVIGNDPNLILPGTKIEIP